MLVVIACPECGHLGRVPEKRVGHKVRCKSCGVTFRPAAAVTPSSPETKKSPKKDGLEKKATEAKPDSGLLGVLKSPSFIDGAVIGAIAGTITGVVMGAITGAIYAGPKSGLGSAIGSGFNGFILGFACGTPIGALLGLIGVYLHLGSISRGWGRAVGFGILIGAGVTAIIVDRYQWIPVGAVVGAVAALIWLGVQTWETASHQPLIRDFNLEEGTATPKTELPRKEDSHGKTE